MFLSEITAVFINSEIYNWTEYVYLFLIDAFNYFTAYYTY